MTERNIKVRWLLTLALTAGAAAAPPQAEPAGRQPSMLSPMVTRLISSEYLTDTERADLRVRHGVWEASDLTDPARRARAALLRGAWDDAALREPTADPLDRAEAMLRRGEHDEALRTLEESAKTSLRALRLRALTLDAQGAREKASEVLREVSERLNRERQQSAWELVEGVRAAHQRTRLDGPQRGAQDFQSLMSMLARAREQLERLCWTAPLAEAELLDEKDNASEAREAIRQALTLNPSAAEAWALLGRMSVDAFDFDRAEKIAETLRELAGPVQGASGSTDAVDSPETSPPSPELVVPVAPLADMLVARTRLRQRDPEAALAALAPTRARFPQMLEARALEAAAVACTFDLERTDALLRELDQLSPGTSIGYLTVGRALSDQRQYADAARYLEEATRRSPRHAEGWIELGLLEVQAARDDRALAALERAEALDPFNTRAANSLKLVREVRSWARIENEHFIVRYRPGVDQALAREMMPVLERIFARVTGDGPGGIRHVPEAKTVIELMPDHAWFSVRIAGMPQVHTMAAATGPLIAMEAPRLGPANKVGAYDWARVVQHEYTHTVTLSRTKNRLPHWFTEAAAVYLEDAPKDWSAVQILTRAYETDTLFDFEDINIAFTRPRKPTDRAQAYAQGAWMYEFMIERFGPEAPLRLMDRYGAGDREPEAFQSVLGRSREAFFTEFHAWAGERLVRWGMHPAPGVPRFSELLKAWRSEQAGDQTRGAEAAPAQDGRRSLEAGAGEDAAPTIEVVDRWLEQYPDHPEVLEVAVRLRTGENRGRATPEMIPLLRRFAAARPVDPTPHRLLSALFLDESSPAHDPAAAIESLEFLDAREQNAASISMQLAKLYAAREQWDLAWAKALRACTVGPYEAANRELAAAIAIRRADYDNAQRQLEALLILEPDRAIHKQRLEALQQMRSR